ICVGLTAPSHTLSLSLFVYPDTATTEIYTLSLHDALPILQLAAEVCGAGLGSGGIEGVNGVIDAVDGGLHVVNLVDGVLIVGNRSEEHTSELQSRENLVCRLLLEKKKKNINTI